MSAAVVTTLIPESSDASITIARYQEGYREADDEVAFSRTVKFGGIFLAGVVFVGGLVEFINNAAEHTAFPVVFASIIACAVVLILISQSISRGLRAQGLLLKSGLDASVNSSPFLSNAQRVLAMSLRKRPPVPECLPVWTE